MYPGVGDMLFSSHMDRERHAVVKAAVSVPQTAVGSHYPLSVSGAHSCCKYMADEYVCLCSIIAFDQAISTMSTGRVGSLILNMPFLSHTLFLAATKQLYKWYFPSVCVSVRLSVRLSHLFHHVPIIVSS